MKINRWFSEAEFSCNDTDRTPAPYIDTNLVAILTLVREKFEKPVIITSSYRTPEYNKAIGGSEHSHHLYTNNGSAADIQIKGVEPIAIYEYLDKLYPESLGLGVYNSFNHIDTRLVKARWDNRKEV